MSQIKGSRPANGILKMLFGRTTIVMLLILLQATFLFSVFHWLSGNQTHIFGGMSLLSAILIVYIINKKQPAEYKLIWILLICILPFFGGLFYLFVQFNFGYRKLKHNITKLEEETKIMIASGGVNHKLDQEPYRDVKGFAKYMMKTGGYPVYENCQIQYFPLGEDKFKAMLEELKLAEQFIFLEYFIVERGVMWDSILEILKEKAQSGVEVRVMYDGMCSLALLPYHYPKELEQYGIKAKMFAPVKPFLTTDQNNRDHRKILVIDGKTAFNGGVNLGDEYINQKDVYGHWKDTAILLKGDAVKTFTLMFLHLWNASEKCPENWEKYLQVSIPKVSGEGLVIPYGDGPTNDLDIAKTAYMDIVNRAQEYVHIMTPYLILDEDFMDSLINAARRGVDVRIVIPHIPDKKAPFAIAHTFFPQLISNGVKVYEYTPGFMHAKVFVSDDNRSVVGTINLDYRSLYLHFECATYLHRHQVIYDIEKDFLETIERCHLYTMEDYRSIPLHKRVYGRVLRIFGPLM